MTARLMMMQEDIDADPRRWLQERRAGVTASEIAAILGLAPTSHKTSNPFALYVAKATGQEPVGDSDEMSRGRHLEPYVAEKFEATHPDLDVYDGGLYCNEDRPWQMATFDRLAVDPLSSGGYRTFTGVDGTMLPTGAVMPVQIKTWAVPRNSPEPELHWGEPGSDDIPVHIRCQAIWEMDVAGAEAALVPCLFMGEWKVHTYVIDRSPAVEHDLAIMRAEALDFLDRLVRREPPPIDWSPSTASALKTLYPLEDGLSVTVPRRVADKYRAAQRAKRKADRMMGAAVNELRAAAPGARYIMTREGGDLVKVASRSVYDQEYTDTEVLRAKHKRAYKASRRSSPVDKLIPGSWAKS